MTFTTRVSLVVLLTLLPGVGAGRIACAEQARSGAPPGPDNSALEQRVQQEKKTRRYEFSILPHKTNYVLPLAYNTSPNNGVYAGTTTGNQNPEKLEVKFQLSIKTPLWDNVFGNNGTLYVAYSQLAFWQAYNSRSSAPFREINFEPEVFMTFKTGYELLGVSSQQISVGFNHQSNGREKPLSRSWNRVIANFDFGSGKTYVTLRPWFRIPDRANNDDNPDMEKYFGYGELFILQRLKEHTLTLMVRNNLRASGNKGAVRADWSFPLQKKLKAYVQFFNGYGESLVDYNHANNRIGVGIMLTDWM